MKEFFRELFEYNHHMNQEFIAELLKQQQNIPEKSRLLMSHLLNAQHIWNSRIEKLEPRYKIWQLHEPGEWATIDSTNHLKTLELLNHVNFDQSIAYKTSQGQPFENTVRDILFHAVNHGTHHRGQIASDMKQNGFEPVVSDYIFYKR